MAPKNKLSKKYVKKTLTVFLLEDLDKNMFCRMVNLFDGFPTLILLKVSSSLLPVLITQKLVANADSQGATGIST